MVGGEHLGDLDSLEYTAGGSSLGESISTIQKGEDKVGHGQSEKLVLNSNSNSAMDFHVKPCEEHVGRQCAVGSGCRSCSGLGQICW